LNCAFSRNLGRGDDVDGLGAIMRGILNTFEKHDDHLILCKITYTDTICCSDQA